MEYAPEHFVLVIVVAWEVEDMTAAGFAQTLPTDFEEIVKVFKPTVIIGTTGCAVIFPRRNGTRRYFLAVKI